MIGESSIKYYNNYLRCYNSVVIFEPTAFLKPSFQCAVIAGGYRRQMCLRQFRYIVNTLPAIVACCKGTLETHCLRISAAAGGTGKKLKHVKLFKVP